MPMGPDALSEGPGAGRSGWRALRLPLPAAAGALLLLLVAGCASAPRTDSERSLALLDQIGRRLPGEYTSVREHDQPAQNLVIERRAATEPGGLALALNQSDAAGGNLRRYGLKLSAGTVETRLEGSFALLDEDGRARRSCAMIFHPGDAGLVGETDPADCRFGEGAQAVGLLKEMAFDGRQIVIGDRLIDLATNEPRGSDQVITFLAAPRYTGWLGVREGEGWRVARGFALQPGRGSVEPLDAADMSLGVAVELSFYRMARENGGVLMRLAVTDSDSGALIAESWAEPGSGKIGLALPTLQVGLSASGTGQNN